MEDRIVGKVAEGVSVPTVEDIIRALPEPPDLSDKLALMEEKMGAKLTAVMEAKWATMGDALLSASRPGRPGQYRLGEECL